MMTRREDICLSLCLLESCCGSVGKEGRRLDDGTLHPQLEKERTSLWRTGRNLSRECAARGPTANRKMFTMVRSISCQSRSHSDGMQRGYFDWQVARPWRRDVWELSGSSADGFCTISSHFLLSVRCRMSITGKSVASPRRRQRKERGTREQQREKKEEEEDVPNSVMSMMSFLSHQTDERAVGAMTLCSGGGERRCIPLSPSSPLTSPL